PLPPSWVNPPSSSRGARPRTLVPVVNFAVKRCSTEREEPSIVSSDGMRTRRRGAAAAIVAASLALVASGCSSSGSSSSAQGSTGAAAASGDKSSTVKISLTSDGCEPKPAKVPAGAVEFDVTNSGAGSVSEAELRTSDKAHILGEQENL